MMVIAVEHEQNFLPRFFLISEFTHIELKVLRKNFIAQVSIGFVNDFNRSFRWICFQQGKASNDFEPMLFTST